MYSTAKTSQSSHRLEHHLVGGNDMVAWLLALYCTILCYGTVQHSTVQVQRRNYSTVHPTVLEKLFLGMESF